MPEIVPTIATESNIIRTKNMTSNYRKRKQRYLVFIDYNLVGRQKQLYHQEGYEITEAADSTIGSSKHRTRMS